MEEIKKDLQEERQNKMSKNVRKGKIKRRNEKKEEGKMKIKRRKGRKS